MWCCSDDGYGIKKPTYGLNDVDNILALKKRMKTERKKKYLEHQDMSNDVSWVSPLTLCCHHLSLGFGTITIREREMYLKKYNNYKLLNIPVESI